MRGVIKMGVITLPVTNRTAAAHLKGVVLRGGDSNAFTERGCERVSNQLAAEPVRWLPYWRLLRCQLLLLLLSIQQLLLSIQQQQQEQ